MCVNVYERVYARACNVIRLYVLSIHYISLYSYRHTPAQILTYAYTRQVLQTHVGTGRPPASRTVRSGSLATGCSVSG